MSTRMELMPSIQQKLEMNLLVLENQGLNFPGDIIVFFVFVMCM